jgi:hypothetical protein
MKLDLFGFIRRGLDQCWGCHAIGSSIRGSCSRERLWEGRFRMEFRIWVETRLAGGILERELVAQIGAATNGNRC